ncbi:O-antigen polysaccharide polymerase Wzy [Dokdonia sinensis]|uniref:O-antigen polysaccharide polymerase Wzy n=1 Tax=Dokdonia sinensis TaxID=2479847 RepID=A0A3M0FZM3_9FLAO|nr:O-antigen polysaccharide polymerase Wzy [Dokdonia sinensis]RMB57955.1 O-antigen polysaccharide polymerase Wzy [Dokdonia sinensis]
MALKTLLLFIYVLITVVLFATFDATVEVWLSFFASAAILAIITLYHLFVERDYSPFISCFIVFTYLFFLVAPIVQINSFEGVNPKFMTLLPYDESVAIKANIFICAFNLLFFLSYVTMKRLRPLRGIPTQTDRYKRVLPAIIIGLGFLSVLVFIASYGFVQDELRRPSWKPSIFGTSILLIWKKVFFLVPFGGILLCVEYLRRPKKRTLNYITIAVMLGFFILLLFWFKNPLVEKRNALGPIYICLLFLGLPRLLNSNAKTLFFMFFSMIILFPLTAIFTHSDASLREILNKPSILLEEMKGGGIASAFNTLNYDAFANIMATMDYVGYHGYSMGYQLLSAFLFFVPRSIWEAKPISTGQLVGEHLIEVHDFRYSNLSNPLVSEGYINFGFFGVLLAAFMLAFVCVRLLYWLKSEDYLKKIMALYFAIHLVFLLRGDFTNGFSYYIGTLVGVIVIPKMVSYFINQLMINQQRWKQSKTA